LVQHNISGILTEPGNVEEIVEALHFFYRHPQKRIEMGQAGRAFVNAEFNLKTNAKKLFNVFRKP
jgi:glycosyltransferase involved in cell wall biosynthesis